MGEMLVRNNLTLEFLLILLGYVFIRELDDHKFIFGINALIFNVFHLLLMLSNLFPLRSLVERKKNCTKFSIRFTFVFYHVSFRAQN